MIQNTRRHSLIRDTIGCYETEDPDLWRVIVLHLQNDPTHKVASMAAKHCRIQQISPPALLAWENHRDYAWIVTLSTPNFGFQTGKTRRIPALRTSSYPRPRKKTWVESSSGANRGCRQHEIQYTACSGWQRPYTDQRINGERPTSNSDTTSHAPMLIEATEDAQKLQKMSLELASARMEIMKLKAVGQTQEAVIQKLRATLEEERKRIETGQDEALQQHKETIRRLREEYTTAVAENDGNEHANSVMTALRLEVAGLRTSLDLTEQHRDQAVSNNIDLQQRLEALEEDVFCMSELLQANEDLRWALAAHRCEIEKLCGAENKMARIEKVFKESFKNAGTSLISINGVYDLEGSLQLLLERDKSRAKELDDVKKQLLEAKNAKPSEEGNHERPRKWWSMSFDWMKTERYLWRGKKTG